MSNETNYKYIVWHYNWLPRPEWRMYVQNAEKTWWLLPDGSGNGFDVDTVIKHSGAFHFFKTEEEAAEFLKVKNWETSNGRLAEEGEEDFKCPSCGVGHFGRDVFQYGDINTSPYKKTCICGEVLSISPEVVVTYSVTVNK